MKNRLFIILLALMTPFMIWAQSEEKIEMADLFRQEGKIYVVVAVVLIIFIGMILYMINLDRKIKKLEQEKTTEKH